MSGFGRAVMMDLADMEEMKAIHLFMLACYNGDLELVQCLMNAGADVHAQEDQALITACEFGRFRVVHLLLKHGADAHAQDNKAFVCAKSNTSILRLLRDASGEGASQVSKRARNV